MKARGVFYFGKFVVMGIALLALFTYVVMLLWNWLVPELFSGPAINYWQTLGVLILAKILFAGFHPHKREDHPWKDRSLRHDKAKSYWRQKFEEKMNGRSAAETAESEPSDGEGD